jgi:NDP-mannose synthase
MRMRTEGDGTHKALLPVDGVVMAEIVLLAVLAHDFRSLAVAVSAEEPELLAFVSDRLKEIAARHDAELACLVETAPLGTIGAAGTVTASEDGLLVVNVDNITAIDLRDLVRSHVASSATMTIASHEEPFRMPFGELEIDGSLVRAYREKPLHYYPVSSGTYVLSKGAIAQITPGERLDIPVLFERLAVRGLSVGVYKHAALWIDVNDHEALRRATRLANAPTSTSPMLRMTS